MEILELAGRSGAVYSRQRRVQDLCRVKAAEKAGICRVRRGLSPALLDDGQRLSPDESRQKCRQFPFGERVRNGLEGEVSGVDDGVHGGIIS